MSTQKQGQSVQKAQKSRVVSVDALRGLAILLILFANISAFSSPYEDSLMGSRVGQTEFDGILTTLTGFFINGKWRSTLILLFGIGLMLQAERALRNGTWPLAGLKRYGILLGFGTLHLVALWFGDILLMYTALGLILAGMVTWESDRIQKAIWKISVGLGVVFGPILLLFFGLTRDGSFLRELSKQGSSETISHQIKVYAQGSYLDQVAERLAWAPMMLGQSFLFTLFALPLALIGILAARNRIWEETEIGRIWRQRMILIGFGVGIPLNATVFWGWPQGRDLPSWLLVEFFGGPFFAVGIVGLGLHLWRSGLGFVGRILLPVGRMALSCYLLQSILGTTIYYSWGFGLFGKTSVAQDVGISCWILAAVLTFAHLWSRRYKMGPFEALWRKWSHVAPAETPPAPPAAPARPGFQV